MQLITLFAILLVFGATDSQINSSCYTKNEEVGVCIGIRQCKPIWEIIRDAPRPLPERIVEYISKSHCGSPEDRTICCLLQDTTTTTEKPRLYQSQYRPQVAIQSLSHSIDDWGNQKPRTTTTTESTWNRYETSGRTTTTEATWNWFETTRSTTTKRPVYIEPQNLLDSGNSIKRETNVNSVVEHTNLRLLDTKNCGHLSMDRIANGNHTELLQYPWMASLGYRNSRSELDFRCGGTLISKRYVMTAGHCITDLPPRTGNLELVRLGEYDFEADVDCERLYDEYICVERPQDIRVRTTIIHPEYNSPKHAHDIALIQLHEDADLQHKRIKPVCMPVTEKLLGTVPQRFIVTGWGTTETGVKANKLMQASMSLYSKDQCLDLLSSFTRGLSFTPGQFCAEGADLVAVCSGDSGGPLLAPEQFFHYGARHVQFGIVSFGPNLCGNRKSYPSVFTDVRYYMKWILDSMQN